jgi:hypothetical protein
VRAFVDRAWTPLVEIRRERYRTLCHRSMSERCDDRSSMPSRHYEPLINIAQLKILLNEVLAITDRSPVDVWLPRESPCSPAELPLAGQIPLITYAVCFISALGPP